MTQIDIPLLNRMRGLLNLTTSTNEHEAALAASRLNDLLAKHNLDLGILSNTEEQKATRLETSGESNRAAHHYTIAAACDKLFDVRHFRSIYTVGYGSCRIRRASRIVFLGLKSNVETAILTFNYLIEAIEEFAKARKHDLVGRAEHRSYKLGAATRIYQDIKAQKESTLLTGSTDCLALVRVGCEVANNAFAAIKFTSASSTPQAASSHSAWAMGHHDGARINPHVAPNSRQLPSH